MQRLLEPTFRESPTITNPILWQLQMVDAGAEFWLSKKDGCLMYLKDNHDNPIKLTRVNNTLGFETFVFD